MTKKPLRPSRRSVQAKPGPPLLVVGLGASAGGLEAITRLFSTLEPARGTAIVIVQHLDPSHASSLIELVGRTTKMIVREAADGAPLQRDHVYIIPPNKVLSIAAGRLVIRPRVPEKGVSLPINEFLVALALERGAESIGVILSGTGTDGVVGIRAVKAAGGTTFAQDPKTAKYPGMPEAAIASGDVDFVLSPEAIGKKLGAIARSPASRAPRGRVLSTAATSPAAADAVMAAILDLLLDRTGVDYRFYRPASVRRRIQRRMASLVVNDMADYLALLRGDPAEVAALQEGILVPLTFFFRDAPVFDILKEKVFPALVDKRPPNTPVRIWVAGCSSGEEAYSIAMSFVEFQEARPNKVPLQLFATDVSEAAVRRARSGIYSSKVAEAVSAPRLQRFFTRSGHDASYQIKKEIREMCVFARHDVNRHPPFSKVDLISCRNVLIYLDRPLQDRVVPIFHYALNSDGFLLLGHEESLPRHDQLFAVEDTKSRVFRKLPGPAGRTPALEGPPGAGNAFLAPPTAGQMALPTANSLEMIRIMDDAVAARMAFAAVIVDERLDVILVRGDCDPYLQVPRGRPAMNLALMARGSLSLEIASAVKRAARTRTMVHVEGLAVPYSGTVTRVSIEVRPLQSLVAPRPDFLVIFEPARGPAKAKVGPMGLAKAFEPPVKVVRERGPGTATRREIVALRERMQGQVEENEAYTEELRSANEEIQSANEELQSTNEELETSREELQSANEELTTLNEELSNANIEMRRSAEYFDLVLKAARFPILVLGGDLRIRRFTAAMSEIMNILPTDHGRPISDLAHKIGGPKLLEALHDVLSQDLVRRLEITDQAGHFFEIVMRGVRSGGNELDGIVLTFMDVDINKRLLDAKERELATEQKRSAAAARLGAVVDGSSDGIVLKDLAGQILLWNAAAERIYQYAAIEIVGRDITTLVPPELQATEKQWRARVAAGETIRDAETERIRKDGTRVFVSVSLAPVRGPTGDIVGIASLERDVTERDRARRALAASEASLLKAKDVELERALARSAAAAQALAEKEVLLREVHHRVKNNLQVVSSLLNLQANNETDEALQAKLQATRRRIGAMAKVHERLHHSTNMDSVNFAGYVRELTAELVRAYAVDAAAIRVHVDVEDVAAGLDTAIHCGLIANELVANAFKHAFPAGRKGSVRVSLRRAGENRLELCVQDDGVGMPPDVDVEKPKTLGLQLVRSLVEQLDGTVEISGTNGVTVRVRFKNERPARGGRVAA